MTEQPLQEEFDLTTEVSVAFPLVPQEPFRLTLAPYTGDAACPKCGAENVMRTWHSGEPMHTWDPCYPLFRSIPTDTFGFPMTPMPEHLDRCCPKCRYEWVEDIKRDEP